MSRDLYLWRLPVLGASDDMGNPCRNVEITNIKNNSGQRETVCLTKKKKKKNMSPRSSRWTRV